MKKRTVVPQYTYRHRSKKEDRAIYRRIFAVSLATLVIIAIIWFWGTSFINLLGFLAKTPIEDTQNTNNNYTLPLVKPALEPLPKTTNKEEITISGTTTAGAEVTLFINAGEADKTTTDNNGDFKFNKVKLKAGLNLLKIVATDGSGNSQETSTVITLDKTAPSLKIAKPADGASFPKNTNTIKVVGVADPQATVLVNGLQALVSPSGDFNFSLSVKEGAQVVEVKATDNAGNTSTVKLTITVFSD